MKNHKFIKFILIILVTNNFSFSQNAIGIYSGFTIGKFINNSNNPNNNWGSGKTISCFYETKLDSINKIWFECQYNTQSLNLMVKNNNGYAAFEKNINYKYKDLGVGIIYNFKAVEKKSFASSIIFGPSFTLLTSNRKTGSGYDFIQVN